MFPLILRHRSYSRPPKGSAAILAEGVGFEPTVPCDTTVFETVRFGHSRIPPRGEASRPVER
jgi:hypothetical protein